MADVFTSPRRAVRAETTASRARIAPYDVWMERWVEWNREPMRAISLPCPSTPFTRVARQRERKRERERERVHGRRVPRLRNHIKSPLIVANRVLARKSSAPWWRPIQCLYVPALHPGSQPTHRHGASTAARLATLALALAAVEARSAHAARAE
ncbi:hypothetical protein MSAN_00623400 [Mycena sanguinolenta]|uniref:Uncharacterized protein n=1 Tax=Mycena sanguinolenta TaxID=230812 RepID=A0A8H6Z0I2_9AGAR|nr:hypothetical protein MSAN_00623400 [Mycena sanguinolenta]